ncbi:MAG: Bax inhibitor-1/YccA family protein [Lachnospiraceae bacterium]|nr:Bax inhibitor-1/YccA family protein [Lachnospiraceae bacterium]
MDSYNQNNYSGGFSEPQTGYNGQFNDGYNGQPQNYDDLAGGFESGNVVHTTMSQLKGLMAEEVINKSFLFMTAALLISAFSAYTARYTVLMWIASNPINLYVLFGAEIAVVLIANFAIRKNQPIVIGILYTIYAYLTGATVGIILMIYTAESVTAVFLITAIMFGVMSVYGLITKNDLSSIGSLLFMGLIGIIVAGVVNMFLRSSMIDMIVCIVGVLIFVGLTAYDAQKIKRMAATATAESTLTLALVGGFELYLDFVNLFLKLLRILGKRK